MTPEEQLDQWVLGKSIHNGKTRKDGECCPDFSCCNPGMLWDESKRKQFKAAGEEERYKMLLGSLSGLMDFHEKRKVHIVGKS